ncbi:MAG: OsmC family protein [Chloroflexota bacterium]
MHERVSLRWDGDLDFEATSGDSDAVRLGGTQSPRSFGPASLLLVSLAGCTGMDAISIMRKKRQKVEGYRIEVSGTQRDEHPRSFTSIVVVHIVEGNSIDDKAVARSIELSARKYCVVGASLASGDTSIEHRLRVTDEAGERTSDCVTIGPRGAGLSHYRNG